MGFNWKFKGLIARYSVPLGDVRSAIRLLGDVRSAIRLLGDVSGAIRLLGDVRSAIRLLEKCVEQHEM
jgi:hypothetical protein